MSALQLATELIRRAARDDNYARDLDDAIQDDETLSEALLQEPLSIGDLDALGTSDLLWFAEWRQARAGQLDRTMHNTLSAALAFGSRFARYRLRGLPMRDPQALEIVTLISPDELLPDALGDTVGLDWLALHARSFRDPAEVARDALQHATPVSWFTLRILTDQDTPGARQTRAYLRAFARDRAVSADITGFWGIDLDLG